MPNKKVDQSTNNLTARTTSASFGSVTAGDCDVMCVLCSLVSPLAGQAGSEQCHSWGLFSPSPHLNLYQRAGFWLPPPQPEE